MTSQAYNSFCTTRSPWQDKPHAEVYGLGEDYIIGFRERFLTTFNCPERISNSYFPLPGLMFLKLLFVLPNISFGWILHSRPWTFLLKKPLHCLRLSEASVARPDQKDRLEGCSALAYISKITQTVKGLSHESRSGDARTPLHSRL